MSQRSHFTSGDIAEAIAKIPVPAIGAAVEHHHPVSQIEQLAEELNDLAEEINDRQLKGNRAGWFARLPFSKTAGR